MVPVVVEVYRGVLLRTAGSEQQRVSHLLNGLDFARRVALCCDCRTIRMHY